MKIERPGPSSVSPARARPGAASGGFSAGSATAAAGGAGATPMAAAGGVGSLGALLALQEANGPLERRRRAVKRAGRLLDGLDAVKLSLLGAGGAVGAALDGLAQATREERLGAEGDVDLQSLLDQIDTRAAVELAKAEMSRRAA